MADQNGFGPHLHFRKVERSDEKKFKYQHLSVVDAVTLLRKKYLHGARATPQEETSSQYDITFHSLTFPR
jgi:hypothetical protein